MITLLGVIAAWTAAIIGYKQTRLFVRNRLRYVEGVHKAFVPLKVGFIAFLVTLPFAIVLPVLTGGAAALFGVSVGLGVSAGRRDIRARRYLGA